MRRSDVSIEAAEVEEEEDWLLSWVTWTVTSSQGTWNKVMFKNRGNGIISFSSC
jgi:hypothetical protein